MITQPKNSPDCGAFEAHRGQHGFSKANRRSHIHPYQWDAAGLQQGDHLCVERTGLKELSALTRR